MPKRTSDCNYMPVSNNDYCNRAWQADWDLLNRLSGKNYVSTICFFLF